MDKTQTKELPDYTLLFDIIKNSYKYTLWEEDICTNMEMYQPGSYIMFQLNVSAMDDKTAQRLPKFYEVVKHLSNEYVSLKFSYEEQGLVTRKKYKISELEIYIFDLERCKESLTEMMRYFKIICPSVKPLMTMDVNMSLIDKTNFNLALDIVRIMK